MSEKQKTANLVSNEAVIEDLTKDLEKSLTTDPDENAEYIINPGTSAEFAPSSGGDSSDIYDAPLTDKLDIENECQEDSEEEKVESDTDSIDEEAMKVAHASLTDEQIIELEKEAGDLKNSGNALFQSGKYPESLEKYTAGLKKCPLKSKQRAFLYSNRAAAKMKMEKYGRAIKDCTKAIEIDDKYLKAYSRRAQCYESTKKYEESLEDHKKILELDIHNKESHAAVARLPRMIEQRNEELKTEMLGKLKDLGNMILKPFGLSTDNFKLQQDPESKGYTVNFQNKS